MSRNSDQTLILVTTKVVKKSGPLCSPKRSAAPISPSPVPSPEVVANIPTMNCDVWWTQERHGRIIIRCVLVATPMNAWLRPRFCAESETGTYRGGVN